MAKITKYDFLNMVIIFERSLRNLLGYLQDGDVLVATYKAKDMLRVIEKLRKHCDAKTD